MPCSSRRASRRAASRSPLDVRPASMIPGLQGGSSGASRTVTPTATAWPALISLLRGFGGELDLGSGHRPSPRIRRPARGELLMLDRAFGSGSSSSCPIWISRGVLDAAREGGGRPPERRATSRAPARMIGDVGGITSKRSFLTGTARVVTNLPGPTFVSAWALSFGRGSGRLREGRPARQGKPSFARGAGGASGRRSGVRPVSARISGTRNRCSAPVGAPARPVAPTDGSRLPIAERSCVFPA